eukprot:UN01042
MSSTTLTIIDNIIAFIDSQDSTMSEASKKEKETESKVEPTYKSGIDYDDDNVFCKIIENDQVLAILDAFPSVEGHSLLISKINKPTILDFTENEAANYLKYLPKLSQIVKTATECSAVNVVSNNGYDSGQRVFHAHFHVIPRTKDDHLFKNPTPSKEMIKNDKAKAMLSKMGVEQ